MEQTQLTDNTIDLDSNDLVNESDDKDIKLTQDAFRQAASNNASEATLKAALSRLINNMKYKLSPEEMKLCEEKLLENTNRVNNAKKDIENSRNDMVRLSEEVKELEDEINEIKSGKNKKLFDEEKTFDPIGISLNLVICIFLIIYIFIFYSSAIYSCVFGNLSQTVEDFFSNNSNEMHLLFNSVFNPKAFSIAIQNPYVFLFVLFAPMVFIAFGILLHEFIQKKKYSLIPLVILVTLIFDIIIAYKISKDINDGKVLVGLIESNWNWTNIFMDNDFYLVIMLGFVAYIVFGIVFHFLMEKINKPSPIQIRKDEIKQKKNKITEMGEQIQKSEKQIINYNAEEKKLKLRKEGVALPENFVKAKVSDFMLGWHQYINSYGGKNVKNKNERANEIVKNLISAKKSKGEIIPVNN